MPAAQRSSLAAAAQRNLQLQNCYICSHAHAAAQVELLCNDCQATALVPFHIVGQKCPPPGCGSYNTRRVTIHRHPPDPEDGSAAAAEGTPPAPPP